MSPASSHGGPGPAWAWLLVSLAALAGGLALPTQVDCGLDGLPWSQAGETYLWLAVIPLFLLLGWRFLGRPWVGILLLLLLGLRLVLMLEAPARGWDIKAYSSPERLASGQWEPTYETWWRPGVSAVMERDYADRTKLPLEWQNRLAPRDQQPHWLGLGLHGWLRLPRGWRLVLIARDLAQGRVRALPADGPARRVRVYPSIEQALRSAPRPWPGGVYHLGGTLTYMPNGQWSLTPLLLDRRGRAHSPWEQRALWRDLSRPGVLDHLGWWRALAQTSQAAYYLLLLAWAWWLLKTLWRQGSLDAALACLIFSGMALSLLVPHRFALGDWQWGDYTQVVSLGLSLCLVWLLLLWRAQAGARWPDAPRVFLLAAAPAMLLFFALKWSGQLHQWELFSHGDDWWVFQNLARAAWVHGDWWDSRHPFLVHQFLYRHLVGLCHLLFGQSPVAQKMLDVWALLAGGWVIAALSPRLGVGRVGALWGAGLFLAVALLGGFRHHIGRGMTEYTAMALFMLCLWTALRKDPGGAGQALGAGLLAGLCFLVRNDYLLALAAVAACKVGYHGGDLMTAWGGLFKGLWRRRGWVLLFGACLAAAMGVLCLRNLHHGGLFVLNDPANLASISTRGLSGALLSLRRLLNADDVGITFPALILWPGTCLGLLALIWRPRRLRAYPLGLSLIFLGLMLPFAFYLVNSSPPRFSIRLLPLACLSLVLLARAWRQGASSDKVPDRTG